MVTANDCSNVNLTKGTQDKCVSAARNGVEIDGFQVELQLTKLKLVHDGWIVEFYNYISTLKGRKVLIVDGEVLVFLMP